LEFIYVNDNWPFRVQTYEPDGTAITVDSATVTITKLETMEKVVDGAAATIHSGYVEYIVTNTITSETGNYIIDWNITLGDVTKSYREFFQVIEVPQYSLKEMSLINALAIRLKDNRPVLYRVDEQERKWHDEELYSFLYYAIADFNGTPPAWTNYGFEDLPPQVYGVILLGAQIAAIIAEATLQAANDFSYNDNGLTVTLSRSGHYMQVASALWNMWLQQVPKIKRYLGFELTHFVGVKTQRMPVSVRRPLSMLPHLESVFSMS